MPITIRADLTQREVARIAVRSPELPGVNFERVEKRIYPQGVLGGHLTGYVNRATADEVETGVITRELANLFTGKSGVEKAFERQLRGYPGRERILVNAVGRPIRTAVDERPKSGADLNLTINMDDQLFAIETLKKKAKEPLPLSSPRVKRSLNRTMNWPKFWPMDKARHLKTKKAGWCRLKQGLLLYWISKQVKSKLWSRHQHLIRIYFQGGSVLATGIC